MALRVITFNANGIRSAARKGFFDWLAAQNADIVCIQETKAQLEILTDALYRPKGYHCYYHDAIKKGYSGVAIYTRALPTDVSWGLGWQCADDEGRYVQIDYKNLSIASLYMPSGTSGEARQALKYEFMQLYMEKLKQLHHKAYPAIIAGDWNIAHKKIDLKNWQSNQNSTGFLPEERAWMDQLFDEVGYVDAFRAINPHPDQYTWWSHRAGAWQKNVGWRIDYQVVSPALKSKIISASIYRETKFSDHAPLTIDYDYQLQV